MRIEKRYYDLAQAKLAEVENEVRCEEAARTEAEWEMERRKIKEEVQAIYRKQEEYSRQWQKVSDPKRMELYQKLSAQALWMADYADLNIVVEDDGETLGKIILEAKGFIICAGTDRSVNALFSNLFLAADDAYIGADSNGLCRIEFWFQLYKEVLVNQTT